MDFEEAGDHLTVNHRVRVHGNDPCCQVGNMDVHVSGGDTVPPVEPYAPILRQSISDCSSQGQPIPCMYKAYQHSLPFHTRSDHEEYIGS